MSLRVTRAEAVEFLTAVLGIWVGIYAFRTFVPTAVWNLSTNLPIYLKGMLAIGVHVIGVAGCVLPHTRRPRATAELAAAVAITGVLRQLLLGSDLAGAALSLMVWVLWLWWLAAYARRLGNDRCHILAPAIMGAFAFQVGMQAAWHGLDLPMARGTAAIACALLLHGLFAFASFDDARNAHPGRAEGSSFVFLALGAVLFLELTLFANVGRVGVISGLELVPAALIIQAGLIAGALLASLPHRPIVVLAVVVGLIVAVLQSMTVVSIVFGQIAIAVLCASAAMRSTKSTGSAYASGMVVLFALLFLFYQRYEWPLLWAVAALILAASAISRVSAPRISATYALTGIAALVLTASGTLQRGQRAQAEQADALQFLTYNIYQGFDAAGSPNIQNLAREIERLNPAVVVLQEVGRGWTFLGGADLIAYLQYRFPNYELHFVPVNGQLWGVALMSRLPLSDLRGETFAADPGIFRYGFVQGTILFDSLPIRVTGVHLSAGLEGGGSIAREQQVEQLMAAVINDANAIVAGDFNAHPDEQPVQRLLSAGFADAGARVGLGALNTWPASAPAERIDYVFVKGKLEAVAGEVPPTTASDHLPVVVRLRLSN